MKQINSVVYGLFGTGAIVFGSAALLFPAALLSDTAQSIHFEHVLREQGAATILVGLMSFWCIFNYDGRRSVHYCLTLFTFLIAGIHWCDYARGRLPWISPVYNTLPFAVFLTMTLGLRRQKQM